MQIHSFSSYVPVRAWDLVSAYTIQNYFRKCGFSVNEGKVKEEDLPKFHDIAKAELEGMD